MFCFFDDRDSLNITSELIYVCVVGLIAAQKLPSGHWTTLFQDLVTLAHKPQLQGTLLLLFTAIPEILDQKVQGREQRKRVQNFLGSTGLRTVLPVLPLLTCLVLVLVDQI